MSRSKKSRMENVAEDRNVMLLLKGPLFPAGHVITGGIEDVEIVDVAGVGQQVDGKVVCFEVKEIMSFMTGELNILAGLTYWLSEYRYALNWPAGFSCDQAYDMIISSPWFIQGTLLYRIGAGGTEQVARTRARASEAEFQYRICSPQIGIHWLRRTTSAATTEDCRIYYRMYGRYVLVDPVWYSKHQIALAQ